MRTRASERASLRGLDMGFTRTVEVGHSRSPNISAGLARDRDINMRRDHFQVHFKSGVMAHQNPAEMSVAPSVELLCVPQAPSRRCALIFLRVTYLSILRRTIGFNEAEIENTTVRAARGPRKVNQRRRMSGTTSPCILRDSIPSPYCCDYADYVLLNYSGDRRRSITRGAAAIFATATSLPRGLTSHQVIDSVRYRRRRLVVALVVDLASCNCNNLLLPLLLPLSILRASIGRSSPREIPSMSVQLTRAQEC